MSKKPCKKYVKFFLRAQTENDHLFDTNLRISSTKDADVCSLIIWSPLHQRASNPGFPSQVLKTVLAPTTSPTKGPTTVPVLVSVRCFLSKLHVLSKLFAHITAICMQGSLKQVHVWKVMASTTGSEVHKPGRAMIQREAILLGSSKLKSTQGNRAAAAYLAWFLLTCLSFVPHVWTGPRTRPGNHRPPSMTNLTYTSLLLPAEV